MKYLILVVALFLFSATTFSQRYLFRSFSTPEGLAQSQVTSICQDSLGYMWIGTLGGLSKYNGNSFKNYSTDNGLINNRVSVVKAIGDKIYVGQQGGLTIIQNDRTSQIPFHKNYESASISSIIEFNGKILLSTSGEGLFELKKNSLVRINLLEDEYLFVKEMYEWKGDLYLATRGGALRTNNLKTVDYFLQNNDYSVSSFAEYNNQLIISTYYNGLLYYNKEKNRITAEKFAEKGILFNHVFVDTRKNIWVSTSNGIIKYNSKEEQVIDNTLGLPLNVIGLTFEDADNNIWFGSQGKGLIKGNHGDITYYDKTTGLVSDIILSGFQSKSGDYFLGTMDGGVIHTKNFKSFQQIHTNSTVWCAIGDIDEQHWFGTKFGLYSYNKQNKLTFYDIEEGIPGHKITAFYKINNTSMYIGGSEGIVLYQNGKLSPVGKNNTDVGTVRNIITHKNKLIIGTDKGLFILNNDKFELISQLNRTIFSIVKHTNGELYFGTEDGLYQIEDFKKVKRIRYSTDVASNYINFISTHRQDLLVGTNNGVYIITIGTGEAEIKRFGINDGLIDAETNLNSSFIDHNDVLWFGTSSGLVRLDLKTFNRKKDNTKLKLKKILLNYQDFQYSKFNAKIENSVPQQMTFAYNQNNLQFSFDGISLNNYEDVYFTYYIEGLDNHWTPLDRNSTLTLTGIPAGTYTVKARIVLGDEEIMDEISINFTIKQAFYRSWWFYSMITLFIATLVFVFVQSRIRREMQKSELEKSEYKARLTTLEQQSLNASMNRHFIFNSLNSIQYFINISDKLSANKYLSNFAKLIRKNLDSSTEENSMVTLGEEIERIELYLTLEAMRFKDKFTYEINTNDVELESILIPAMMIQPFVENSIIHGVLPQTNKLGHISINVEKQHDYLLLEIADNGIGIEKSIAQKKSFAGDHKSKGMEITMKRIDLIQKLSGRDMELIGPKEIKNNQGETQGTAVYIKIMLNNLED